MTTNDIGNMLKESELPVYYDHARQGATLPYIAFTTTASNFFADNKTYQRVTSFRAVLYTASKRSDLESTIEGVFDAHDIPWDRDELYDSGSEVFQEIYESEVL